MAAGPAAPNGKTSTSTNHRHAASISQAQNHKAQLANAYNELGKELSSQKIRVVGNYTLGKVIGEGASPQSPHMLVHVWLCAMACVRGHR